MGRVFYSILFASFYLNSCYSGKIFETADEIFESVIGDVYETKKSIRNNIDLQALRASLARAKSKSTNATTAALGTITKAPPPYATTIKHYDLTPELTTEYRHKIKMKLLLEEIMRTNHTIPDLSKNMGDPTVLTKAFDAIEKPTRRQTNKQYYHYLGPWRYIYPNKIRVISMMSHFVYATRYKLVHAQVMRKRYLETFQFRIGYCFGLLRELKRKQKVIYNVWQFHHRNFRDLLTYMNFYEKIIRLDVDIRDVLELIKSLVRGWKLQVDPEYFDRPLRDF